MVRLGSWLLPVAARALLVLGGAGHFCLWHSCIRFLVASDPGELGFEALRQACRLRLRVRLFQGLDICCSKIFLLVVVVAEAVELDAEFLKVVVVHEHYLFVLVSVEKGIACVEDLLVLSFQHVLHLQVEDGSQDGEDIALLHPCHLLLVYLGQDSPQERDFGEARDELEVVLQAQLGGLNDCQVYEYLAELILGETSIGERVVLVYLVELAGELLVLLDFFDLEMAVLLQLHNRFFCVSCIYLRDGIAPDDRVAAKALAEV